MSNRLMTRRESLRCLAKSSGITMLYGLFMYGGSESKRKKFREYDDLINPNPIISPYEDMRTEHIKDWTHDIKINNFPFKLVGVEHSRRFAVAQYYALEELVKDCSVAVLEAGPEDIVHPLTINDAKAYFGTMTRLCHKYNKPVVTLDGLTVEGSELEIVQDLAGIFLLSHGYLAFDPSSHNLKDEKMARRLMISTCAKIIGGFYLMMSMWERAAISLFENKSHLFVNHVIDQRNVQITERLTWLTKTLPKKYLQNGKFIMANFGKFHTEGVKFYLNHPNIKRIKQAIYAGTYDLVDSDKINIYWPSNLGWDRIPLRE